MLAHPPSLQQWDAHPTYQGARHFLTLLANGISGRKIARHAVFPLMCALSLAMWNEK
jgi:hypothetical protein